VPTLCFVYPAGLLGRRARKLIRTGKAGMEFKIPPVWRRVAERHLRPRYGDIETHPDWCGRSAFDRLSGLCRAPMP